MKIYEIQTKYKVVGTVKEEAPIQNSSDIARYLKGAFDNHIDQEQFWTILLDGANKPIARALCTLGLVNQTQIHPREAFRFAVREGAVSVMFAHNHPSGSLKASNEDIHATRNLVEAGKILNIPVLDHLIISDVGFKSIRATNPSLFAQF